MMTSRKDIADIVGLSPMQEAVLYNSLRMPTDDPGFLQISCTLGGDLDPPFLRQACETVTRRHTALRTSVHWEGLDAPVQMIHREVDIVWQEMDLRPTAGDDRPDLTEILRADRRDGLDLTSAPVNRFSLYRMGAHEWCFVWSCHHVLLDGWSGGLVISEIVSIHDALVRGDYEYTGPSIPHTTFVRRSQDQREDAALSFWKEKLKSFSKPTPLPFSGNGASSPKMTTDVHRVSARLSVRQTDGLMSALREAHITLGAAVQAAWAVVLASGSNIGDVLFGITDSGRAGIRPEIESTVGLLINTLPVRTAVDLKESFSSLAARLLAFTASAREHAHVAPEKIRSCAPLESVGRLYESLVVVQNYPGAGASGGTGLLVSNLRGGITSNYPLTFVVLPGVAIELHVLADHTRFKTDELESLLETVRSVLFTASGDPDIPVGEAVNFSSSSSIASFVGDGMESRSTSKKHPPLSPAVRLYGARPRTTSVPYVAPNGALETQLAHIWSRVLNVDMVGIDDDFFEIGGHSLLVLEVVADIERVLGKRLPIVTLVRQTTVRKLAAVLKDDGWTPPWSSLIPMQPEGKRPALFCIHSWMGNILMYRRLAKELAPDVPVYGLQAIGLDEGVKPHTSIEEMAAHYIAEMKSERPNGPYALLGYCFSAGVASEMARQLHESGDEVCTLFIVDMPPRLPKDLKYYIKRTLLYLREVGLLGLIRSKAHWWTRKTLRQPNGTETRDRVSSALSRIERANKVAWLTYEFGRIPGSIVYIESGERSRQFRRSDYVDRWRKIVEGEVVLRTVEGGHGQLFKEPSLFDLASVIREELPTELPSRGMSRGHRGDG